MSDIYKCPSCNRDFDWDRPDSETPLCPHCGHLFSSQVHPLPENREVGDYVIEKHLGIGGMGEVFLATQKSMRRPVALKILQQALANDEKYLERFFREVRMLAQIEHQNVVKAIEAGMEGDICYFSMMYIPGTDLKKKVDAGVVFAELDALRIIRRVAHALSYVWRRHHLIHRDVKPANIMVTPDMDVKLMDLGISKKVVKESDSNLTVDGMMVGSPTYISPEQARAESDVDFRADMYSLGASYYHLITGKPPYEAENPMGVVSRHLTDPIPDPQDIVPGITEGSSNLINRMMQKRKEDRFTSWDDCLAEIDSIIEDLGGSDSTTYRQPIHTPPPEAKKPAPTPAPKKSVKLQLNWHRILALLVLLILFLMAFFAVVKHSIREGKRREAERYYQQALVLAKQTEDRDWSRIFQLLEKAYRVRSPEISTKAREMLEKMEDERRREIRREERDKRDRAVERLKQRSFEYEKRGEYGNAMEVWQEYARSGQYRDNVRIKIAIKNALEYLKRRKRDKEQGIDN